MAAFFTADGHFGHAAVLRLSRRPFRDVAAMNEAMVLRWNAIVGPDDEVWHLGDFGLETPEALAGFRWRLAGRKRPVIGDHDVGDPGVLDLPWHDPPTLMVETAVDGIELVLCHYPLMSWHRMGNGAIHLHGHMHGRFKPTRQACDFGVDPFDFALVRLDALPAFLSRQAPWRRSGRTSRALPCRPERRARAA